MQSGTFADLVYKPVMVLSIQIHPFTNVGQVEGFGQSCVRDNNQMSCIINW